MKSSWLILSGVCVASCASNNGLQYESVSSTNVYHIARVQKGMSEKQVLQIMHKPYRYESFAFAEDVYDVWFYVTRATGLGQSRMVPQNLTPLTFKNGVLVGTGYYWYYYAMRAEAEEATADLPQIPKPKSQGEQDKEFEKTLDKAVKPPRPAVQTKAEPVSLVKPWKAPLHKGMSEAEVSNVLGSPSKNETFQVDNDRYDVWFYPKKVPLTFKNGALAGMTMDYYREIRKSAGQDKVDGYDRAGERGEEDESDQNFNFW